MLVGYVSSERYLALPDVLLEFENKKGSVEVRSRATGAVYADIKPGAYKVTLYTEGFGAKSVNIQVKKKKPHHFRLLSNNLVGYAWPKWVRLLFLDRIITDGFGAQGLFDREQAARADLLYT